MKTKRIVGELRPTNEGSVTNNTAYQIYDAVEENALGRIIYNAEGWSEGVITIDTTSHLPSDFVINPAESGGKVYLLVNLASFIRAEGVDELNLEGTIEYSVKNVDGTVDSIELFVRKGSVEFRGDTSRLTAAS